MNKDLTPQICMPTSSGQTTSLHVRTHEAGDLATVLPRLESYLAQHTSQPLSRHSGWLKILKQGLSHTPFCLEAVEGERTRGLLPLAFVRSFLFGRFLVSLPYLNYGGVHADDSHAAMRLIDRAVELADELNVRYLELRHEHPIEHPRLNYCMSSKVHMRLGLPTSTDALWKQLSPKVRNQVRKGQKAELSVAWGGQELVEDFYAVFCRNMRDLGTPVYSRKLFQSILEEFTHESEFCVVRMHRQPVAASLLLHGRGITEVPSASSLKDYNATCANMLMYWHLLERAVQRGQTVFDFGRSSEESSTCRFKKQWGASPSPANWQYYVRQGTPSEMRPDDPRYRRRIAIWRRLPVSLTRLFGPLIVRGIP